jgi:hypothetical protein
MKLLKKITKFYAELKLFIRFLKSPFINPWFEIYFGPICKGVPHFLPRKTVNITRKEALEIRKDKKYDVYSETMSEKEILKMISNTRKFVQIKYFGLNTVGLGYKYKWGSIRYEWSPILSLVLFGKQFYIEVNPKIPEHSDDLIIYCYWEAWLTYDQCTDHKLPIEDRLNQLFSKYHCTWTSNKGGIKESVDYYPLILKPKYRSLYGNYGSHII